MCSNYSGYFVKQQFRSGNYDVLVHLAIMMVCFSTLAIGNRSQATGVVFSGYDFQWQYFSAPRKLPGGFFGVEKIYQVTFSSVENHTILCAMLTKTARDTSARMREFAWLARALTARVVTS